MVRRAAILLGLIGLVAALWALGGAWLHRAPPVAVRPQQATLGPLPAISATHANGQPFTGWASVPEKAKIITLWASWCSVCMAELPAKITYAQTHPNVALVAINIDATPARHQAALKRLGAPLNLANIIWLLDPTKQGAYTPLQASGVPETFIANSANQIVYKQNGPLGLHYGPLAAALQQALGPD